MYNQTCYYCKQDYCVQCKTPWHDALTCAEVRQKEQEERDKLKKDTGYVPRASGGHSAHARTQKRATADCLSTNYYVERGMNCPKCQHLVVKSEMCNHIKCICNTDFCYLCGKELSPEHKGTPCPVGCKCSASHGYGADHPYFTEADVLKK